MRWRLLNSLFVISTLVFSASIGSPASAQDASAQDASAREATPTDPLVEALGGAPAPTDVSAQTPARQGEDPAPVDRWIDLPTGRVQLPTSGDGYLVVAPNQNQWAQDLWSDTSPGANVFIADGAVNSWVNLASPFGSNANTVELTATIEGDRVRVTLNGQPVPADQLARSGDAVTVRDENGRSVATITVTNDGRVTIPEGFSFRGPAAWTKETTQRKVIGVRTGSLDPALAKHLQLTEGEGILITDVIDGQPAARAGLQAHDVIVAIHGQRPASLAALRGALDAVAGNGTMRFTIVRAGKTFDVECGVASISTPIGNVTTLPGGRYALSTTGDAPTSLFWQRESEGGRATAPSPRASGQRIATFPSGGAPLPSGKYSGGRNLVIDSQGRPIPTRGRTGTGGGFTIVQGQNSGGGGVEGLSSGSNAQGASGRTVIGIGSTSTSASASTKDVFGGVGIAGPATAFPGRIAPAPENSKVFEERTKAIEERLERLEKLLEKLVEQKRSETRAATTRAAQAVAASSERESAAIDPFFEILFAPF